MVGLPSLEAWIGLSMGLPNLYLSTELPRFSSDGNKDRSGIRRTREPKRQSTEGFLKKCAGNLLIQRFLPRLNPR
jgi:hypothetical protein